MGWESWMSDLTVGLPFKVKRWFTGFGELSFRWILICIGSPMRRSSYSFTFALDDLSGTLIFKIFQLSNQRS